MGGNGNAGGRSPRCIALVGPQGSGKTSLFEAILARAGATHEGAEARKTVGDTSPEAKNHGMSVESNVASFEYLGDRFTALDFPGSIEFQFDGTAALPACDTAVVVCEADEKKLYALQSVLKSLEAAKIPHFLFINKIDKAGGNIAELLSTMQPASGLPLVLRQVPIQEGGAVSGFVDLALERAFVYRPHAPSELIDIPNDLAQFEAEQRFSMLEKLADYDDALMEQLLSDSVPSRDQIFADLVTEFKRCQICPVFFGSAEAGHGIGRLLKALRHESPFVTETAERLGFGAAKSAAYVVKTIQTSHAGKLSLARVLAGQFADGGAVHSASGEERISGVFSVSGPDIKKRGPAEAGEVAAFGKLEGIHTGEAISGEKGFAAPMDPVQPPKPVYALAIAVGDRKDEIKLTSALAKLIDEDPALSLHQDRETGEMVLWGQGEMHLRVALEKLARRFGVKAETRRRQIPYRETIRKSVEVRGRHKKQSGGHGQFGDVLVEIRPQPRGEGFAFTEVVTGGAVPRNYFGAVEAGVRDYLSGGPLGFPVVDVAVTLKDGSYHTVDSSDQAFRLAGRLAMVEGMPKCQPVLLEPVAAVSISVPTEATAKVNGMISARRGQILGFDARPGWTGWDTIEAHIPEAEIHDLIIELRSATAGAGHFKAEFDHLIELSGRVADQIVAERAEQRSA
ncbi:elongation factor G [Rhodomicrobium vannielii ATCC 17100]|uniref:elongation factor G n=1 Tax=Rhodomicrobium vannielii TaxID=1069 RepID=UPI0019193B65|nr:elongation factor G [Rhodomicrobium vannielii]MBJ7533893.1 elongation factor G [Rhodomicrobium vannielii ATCC 17100]